MNNQEAALALLRDKERGFADFRARFVRRDPLTPEERRELLYLIIPDYNGFDIYIPEDIFAYLVKGWVHSPIPPEIIPIIGPIHEGDENVTLLEYAACLDNLRVVYLLLQHHGVKVRTTRALYALALFKPDDLLTLEIPPEQLLMALILRHGKDEDLKLMDELLDELRVDVNYVFDGHSLMYAAVAHAKPSIVQLLISYDAQLNPGDFETATPDIRYLYDAHVSFCREMDHAVSQNVSVRLENNLVRIRFKASNAPQGALEQCFVILQNNMEGFEWDADKTRLDMSRRYMYYILLQNLDGRVIGFAAFCLMDHGHGVYLYELQVHAEFKGRGVEAQLLRWCAELSYTAAGQSIIFLTVLDNNTDAIRLYTELGFTGRTLLELRLAHLHCGQCAFTCFLQYDLDQHQLAVHKVSWSQQTTQ